MTSAMFYPHIHFRSRKWLRTALLYYDQITRIVPEGFDPNTVQEYAHFAYDAEALCSEVKELEAAGFIRNLAPDSESVSETADEFLIFVSQNLLDPVRKKSVIPLLRRRNPWMTIHPSKIDPGLLEILREHGLAHRSDARRSGDWDLDAPTAALYMMYLSTKMAQGRPLTTDNPNYQKLLYSHPVRHDESERVNPDDSFTLVSATFESMLPDSIEELPITKLLHFRDEYGAARSRFQSEITRLAAKMTEARDEEELHQALSIQSSVIAEEQALLRDKLSFGFRTFTAAVFSISVPSYVLPIVTGHPLAIVGAGAAVIGLTAYKYALDRKITKQSSPYSYLLAVGELSGMKVANDLMSLDINPDDDYDDRQLVYA